MKFFNDQRKIKILFHRFIFILIIALVMFYIIFVYCYHILIFVFLFSFQKHSIKRFDKAPVLDLVVQI